MEILDTDTTILPPRIIIYGEAGLGKSTLAASAPKPIFINIENRLDKIKTKAFPLATTYDMVFEQLKYVYNTLEGFETLVIDTLDALEVLINNSVCQEHKVKSLSDIDFGKGWDLSTQKCNTIMNALNNIRDKKNMNIIMLAHVHIQTVNNLLGSNYDRYDIKLREKNAAVFAYKSDLIGFLRTDIDIDVLKGSFGKQIIKSSGGAKRIISFYKSVAFQSKDSYGLETDIEIPKENGFQAILNAIEENKNKKIE